MPMTPEKLEAVRKTQEWFEASKKAAEEKEAARQKAGLEAQRIAAEQRAFSSGRRKLNRLGFNMQMQDFLESGMNPAESFWYKDRLKSGYSPVALNTSAGLTPEEQAAIRNAGLDKQWAGRYFSPRSTVNKNLPTIFGYDPNPPPPAPPPPVAAPAGMQSTEMAGYNPRQARNVTMHKAKKGGSIQAYASGGAVKSRGDGCAQRGKTKGKIV